MFDNFIFAESQLKSIEEERIANSRHLEIAALCKQQQQSQERNFNKDQDLPVLTARQRRFKFSIKFFNFLSAKK
jgi:hypothetical protein